MSLANLYRDAMADDYLGDSVNGAPLELSPAGMARETVYPRYPRDTVVTAATRWAHNRVNGGARTA